MSQLLIINGPNLNLLGSREPDLYGHQTLDDIITNMHRLCVSLTPAIQMTHFQSNHEGEIIDNIQQARDKYDAIIINAGGFSHTSVAIFDALNNFSGYVIEVHLTNIHQREEFRHHSYISARADAVIVGCGALGYEFALTKLAELFKG